MDVINSEVSFSNGEIYKVGTNLENNPSKRIVDNCSSTYHTTDSDFLDSLFPLFSINKCDDDEYVKYYYPTNNLYKELFGESSKGGKDITKYDLSPDAELWFCVAYYQGMEHSYDLLFSVEDDKKLRKISEYYGLEFPLPKGESLDYNKEQWHYKDFNNLCINNDINTDKKFVSDFKIGSVKFKNDKPYLIKMYKPNYED